MQQQRVVQPSPPLQKLRINGARGTSLKIGPGLDLRVQILQPALPGSRGLAGRSYPHPFLRPLLIGMRRWDSVGPRLLWPGQTPALGRQVGQESADGPFSQGLQRLMVLHAERLPESKLAAPALDVLCFTTAEALERSQFLLAIADPLLQTGGLLLRQALETQARLGEQCCQARGAGPKRLSTGQQRIELQQSIVDNLAIESQLALRQSILDRLHSPGPSLGIIQGVGRGKR